MKKSSGLDRENGTNESGGIFPPPVRYRNDVTVGYSQPPNYSTTVANSEHPVQPPRIAPLFELSPSSASDILYTINRSSKWETRQHDRGCSWGTSASARAREKRKIWNGERTRQRVVSDDVLRRDTFPECMHVYTFLCFFCVRATSGNERTRKEQRRG